MAGSTGTKEGMLFSEATAVFGGLAVDEMRRYYEYRAKIKMKVGNTITIIPLTGIPLAAQQKRITISEDGATMMFDPIKTIGVGTPSGMRGNATNNTGVSVTVRGGGESSPSPTTQMSERITISREKEKEIMTVSSSGSRSPPSLSREQLTRRPTSREGNASSTVGTGGTALPKIDRENTSTVISGSTGTGTTIGGGDELHSHSVMSRRPTSPYYDAHAYKEMFVPPIKDGQIEALSGVLIPKKNKKALGTVATVNTTKQMLVTGDMNRIRFGELILLKEEERHGKFGRDPEGRLVPLVTVGI